MRRAIAEALGIASTTRCEWHSVQGGDICRAFKLTWAAGRVFVKTHDAAYAAMFEAEAMGLAAIAASATVRVPQVLLCDADSESSWLVLEWLDFSASSHGGGALLGTQLAAMHRHTAAAHGWKKDNFIGLSRQSNHRYDRWCDFFANERLGAQRDMAAAHASTRPLADDLARLIEHVPCLLADHAPAPSLLHGDLWGGNWGSLAGGEPVLFDPACYYGDRETDLAMTELFGGFGAEFYLAYDAAWPRAPGYSGRRDLYQLYHIANHANLFGGSYVERARSLTARLLQRVGDAS